MKHNFGWHSIASQQKYHGFQSLGPGVFLCGGCSSHLVNICSIQTHWLSPKVQRHSLKHRLNGDGKWSLGVNKLLSVW